MGTGGVRQTNQPGVQLIPLLRTLIRPYRADLFFILLAMLVQTLMSLTAPWPLKIILDNVVGSHKLPSWLDNILKPVLAGGSKMQIVAAAAFMVVIIAMVGALASHIANYYTESVGQWVANDLCMRTYHHLERLSLGYFDSHQTGGLLSTISTDIQTIQSFASTSTLSIVVDLFAIVGMLGIMFWLNWDFTLIVVAVTPFMLVMASRFKNVVKKATHEVRKQQSNMVAVLQQGLESMRVVKAFGRQDLEQEELGKVSRATVDAAGGLRIMDDVGIKVHKRKHLKLQQNSPQALVLPGRPTKAHPTLLTCFAARPKIHLP